MAEIVNPPPHILLITGPTASGKTTLGLSCAERLGGEIVSADSRQVYRGMDIGTAKSVAGERVRVRHHCSDIREPAQAYSAGQFFEDANAAIAEALSRGKRPIVVGGSGLYVRVLMDGIFDAPETDAALRSELEASLAERGHQALHDELRELDPEAAAFVPATNTERLLRALEVCRLTGERYSELRTRTMKPARYEFFPVALRWERKELYSRINLRVDRMLAAGFLDEVRSLLSAGVAPSLNAMKSVGYVEAVEYLAGDCSYDEMVELMKRNTRRFAKRQLTWFRRERRLRWYDMREDAGDVSRQIEILAERIALDFRRTAGDDT